MISRTDAKQYSVDDKSLSERNLTVVLSQNVLQIKLSYQLLAILSAECQRISLLGMSNIITKWFILTLLYLPMSHITLSFEFNANSLHQRQYVNSVSKHKE